MKRKLQANQGKSAVCPYYGSAAVGKLLLAIVCLNPKQKKKIKTKKKLEKTQSERERESESKKKIQFENFISFRLVFGLQVLSASTFPLAKISLK